MTTTEERLAELYIANIGRLHRGWPAWVNDRRRDELESFTLGGLPGREDEAYRHFDLPTLLEGYGELPEAGGADQGEGLLSIGECHRITVVDGECASEGVHTTPDGAVYGSLRAASGQYPQVVGEYYGSCLPQNGDAVSSLAAAFTADGAFVYVPQGCSGEKPFHIDLRYSSQHQTICFPRILVVLGRNSRARVVVTHNDTSKEGMAVVQLREVITEEGAGLELTEAVSMRDESVLVCTNYSRQGASSTNNATALWLRGGAVRINAVNALGGRDSDSTLYGLYFAGREQLCDVTMRVRHEVEDCSSNEVVKGVVSGNATGAFTGMVYVAPDAQRTSALQQSRNLQLSDTSRVFTEPQLEIYADDVKCSHGATVGQLDDQAVYYMRQRGISEADAKKLQLWGFVNDVISHCTDTEACEALTELARVRIEEL